MKASPTYGEDRQVVATPGGTGTESGPATTLADDTPTQSPAVALMHATAIQDSSLWQPPFIFGRHEHRLRSRDA